ncbi:MAG: glucosyltransferase domain-containing protein [Bacteroidota bacterium]
MKNIKSHYLVFAVLVIIVMSFLFSGIFMNFAMTDTYDFMWNWANQGFLLQHIRDGRPLYGLLSKLIYPNISSIEQFKYVRLVALLFMFVFSLCFYRMLIKYDFPKVKSMLIVILFLASPFAGITVHWVVLCLAALALMLVIIASDIAMDAFMQKQELSTANFILKLVVSGLLGVCVLCIYQPIFPVFILPAFLIFLKQRNLKGLWYFLFFNFAIYAIYFVIYNGLLSVLELEASARGGIGFSGAKVMWFINGAISKTWLHSLVFVKYNFRIIIRVITGVAVLYFIFRQLKLIKKEHIFEYVLTLVMFYILAYLPNFLAADIWVSYRSLGGVTAVTTVLFIIAFHEVQLPEKMTNIICGVFVSIALVSGFYNNHYSIAQVQSNEYAAVKEELKKNVVNGLPKAITTIAPKDDFLYKNKIVPLPVTDEFGLQSSSRKWVPIPMIKQALFEITGNRSEVDKIVFTMCDDKNPLADSLKTNSLVVDFDLILDAYYKKLKKANK